MNKSHGAAKPYTVRGMKLCPRCLNDDWKNYWVVLT